MARGVKECEGKCVGVRGEVRGNVGEVWGSMEGRCGRVYGVGVEM